MSALPNRALLVELVIPAAVTALPNRALLADLMFPAPPMGRPGRPGAGL